jgi:hypothetical protein
MKRVWFRFYAELNDFLPPARRQIAFPLAFDGRESVKDLIESLGVPHTEIDLVLVNGDPADFARLVNDGDRVSTYPAFRRLDIGSVTRVRPAPVAGAIFVLDTHLGRLAAYLRLAGFDAQYRADWDDETLASMSRDEQRILLTRDQALLKRRAITHGYYVRDTSARRQLIEVIRRFDLLPLMRPFSRCLRCNSLVEPVAREAVVDQLPPRTRLHYHEFSRCPTCSRVYWKGSHHDWMRALLERATAEARTETGDGVRR